MSIKSNIKKAEGEAPKTKEELETDYPLSEKDEMAKASQRTRQNNEQQQDNKWAGVTGKKQEK